MTLSRRAAFVTLAGAIAVPAVIRIPGLLMPVKPYYLTRDPVDIWRAIRLQGLDDAALDFDAPIKVCHSGDFSLIRTRQARNVICSAMDELVQACAERKQKFSFEENIATTSEFYLVRGEFLRDARAHT